MNRKQISIRITVTEDQKKGIEAFAKKKGVSVSELTRDLWEQATGVKNPVQMGRPTNE